jgi:hypothetical protein
MPQFAIGTQRCVGREVKGAGSNGLVPFRRKLKGGDQDGAGGISEAGKGSDSADNCT